MYIFVGLGNPGKEYEETRHNTGRMLLEWFGKLHGAEWSDDKKFKAKISKVKVGKTNVTLVLPETFMNDSGKSLKVLFSPGVPSGGKQAEKMVVIYDDLDLPFGSAKISFNKSSGGHKGLESIIKTVKTEKFPRIRVGISSTSLSGKIRKPQGEPLVMKHILGKFKPGELIELKKLSKKVNLALETFVSSGFEKTMTEFN